MYNAEIMRFHRKSEKSKNFSRKNYWFLQFYLKLKLNY